MSGSVHGGMDSGVSSPTTSCSYGSASRGTDTEDDSVYTTSMHAGPMTLLIVSFHNSVAKILMTHDSNFYVHLCVFNWGQASKASHLGEVAENLCLHELCCQLMTCYIYI